MKITKNEIIRVLTFLVLFSIILSSVTKIFHPKWSGSQDTVSKISTFYSQPKNIIDVLFLGGSSIRTAISPLFIWEKYGIPGYVRAAGNQAPVVTYNLLVESLKYQDPKVVVLDGIQLFTTYDVDEKEAFLRKSVDPLRFSIQKLNIIYYIATRSSSQTVASYLFPLLRYHSRWKELTWRDFSYASHLNTDYQNGATAQKMIEPQELPHSFMAQTNTPDELDKESVEYFKRIIRLCQMKGIDVVMVSFPKVWWKYSKHLAIENFLQEFNIPYIDYNLTETMASISFNPNSDFYDSGHVSINGTLKISSHFGAFLRNNYDLDDKRGDTSYAKWNEYLTKYYENFLQ